MAKTSKKTAKRPSKTAKRASSAKAKKGKTSQAKSKSKPKSKSKSKSKSLLTAAKRIGFVIAAGRDDWESYIDAFKDRLTQRGWTIGVGTGARDVFIDFQPSNGAMGNITDISYYANEFVQNNVDVIVTAGTEASLTCKNAISNNGKNTPFVFASVGDPVGCGLVGSLYVESRRQRDGLCQYADRSRSSEHSTDQDGEQTASPQSGDHRQQQPGYLSDQRGDRPRLERSKRHGYSGRD